MTNQIGIFVEAREVIATELGSMIYEDLARLEDLIAHADGPAAAEKIQAELHRNDERQQRKWALITRYRGLGLIELDNLVYLELKRYYLALNALQQAVNPATAQEQESK